MIGVNIMNRTSITADTHIIEVSDLETISTDDDDEVQIVDTISPNKNSQQNVTNNNTISKEQNCKTKRRNTFKIVIKENKLLMEFVEQCLEIAPFHGMVRVINRTLIPIYQEADKEYVKSRSFEKLVTKLLVTLKSDPNHKFTHIRTLCDSLKLHKKKKVGFVTLSTNLNGKSRKRKCSINNIEESIEIIDLDNENDFLHEAPSINSNTNVLVQPLKEHVQSLDINQVNMIPQQSPRKSESEENRLLIPNTSIVYEDLPLVDDAEKAKNIKDIEEQIANFKAVIARLDEAEVNDDTIASPYIRSERYKLQIVKLYKILCQLTGSQVVKRREIRLQVLEGHPAGPVQKFEEFLNNNIGEDGDLPFPDLCDVIKCVMKANKEDGLGWNKKQVEKEARALFTQCGRALQKRRQDREWRDLLGKVNLEKCEDDPADHDPQLLARLEENRRFAARKEHDILERFANMQDIMRVRPTSELSEEIILKESASDSDSTNDVPSSPTSSDHKCPSNDPDNLSLVTSTTEMNIKDAITFETDNNFIVKPENETIDSIETSISTSVVDTQDSVDNATSEDVKIKEEPKQDIVTMLNDLGDNYTTTVIFDSDDPFLVIEISDSSDDETAGIIDRE